MNKKSKLTRWISGRVKPAIPGVYERHFCAENIYSRWTGTQWLSGCYKGVYAANSASPSNMQSLKWRGLVEMP